MSSLLYEPKFRACVEEIVRQAGIGWAVETGTYDADGAIELRKMLPAVYTIEARADFAANCADKARQAHVVQFVGSSPEVLRRELPGLIKGFDEPPLFFLDAHWQDYWPLRDELEIINEHRAFGLRCVVIVHDMFVPRAPQFSGCYGGGGTPGHPLYGPRTFVDPTPCDYATFAKELNKFPHFYWPNWEEGGIGFGVASDFKLDLPEMKVMR